MSEIENCIQVVATSFQNIKSLIDSSTNPRGQGTVPDVNSDENSIQTNLTVSGSSSIATAQPLLAGSGQGLKGRHFSHLLKDVYFKNDLLKFYEQIRKIDGDI